jgi:hypothetical protein
MTRSIIWRSRINPQPAICRAICARHDYSHMAAPRFNAMNTWPRDAMTEASRISRVRFELRRTYRTLTAVANEGLVSGSLASGRPAARRRLKMSRLENRRQNVGFGRKQPRNLVRDGADRWFTDWAAGPPGRPLYSLPFQSVPSRSYSFTTKGLTNDWRGDQNKDSGTRRS